MVNGEIGGDLMAISRHLQDRSGVESDGGMSKPGLNPGAGIPVIAATSCEGVQWASRIPTRGRGGCLKPFGAFLIARF